MKVPDKFPEGSRFVFGFSGDEFASIPGKGWFKASDDGASLIPLPGMAAEGPATGSPASEAAFVATLAKSREFAAKAAS
jgi:hypothetical protein